MTRVIRTDTGHLRVDGKWFSVEDVSNASFNAVKAAGSKNPAFDMPPFCYTGCPYAEAIIGLNCDPKAEPDRWSVEVVPHDGKKPWRHREPIWPKVFSIDQELHEG